MTDSEKLDLLAGRIHALMGFAGAVISTHPNVDALARELDKFSQVNLARAESAPVSDKYVEGVQEIAATCAVPPKRCWNAKNVLKHAGRGDCSPPSGVIVSRHH